MIKLRAIALGRKKLSTSDAAHSIVRNTPLQPDDPGSIGFTIALLLLLVVATDMNRFSSIFAVVPAPCRSSDPTRT